ncbi:hypothetical protein BJ138DRAFT_1020899, partial [Hygrophoropsis aurantiaca]
MFDQQLARTEAKTRQILLDPSADSTLFPSSLPHPELVTKLKSALESLTCDLSKPPTIRSVTRIRNGGIIMEMDRAESATWIKSTDVKLEFISALNSEITMKDRTYSILVPFVPLEVHPEQDETLRALEAENSLANGSLVSMRWIKPSTRRNPEQRCAHAMLVSSDPMAANLLI